MNFLVAFMCDKLVKLTEQKQTQENKVMLQLSTEVIKTKIFFEENLNCCGKKHPKKVPMGNFYIVVEKIENTGKKGENGEIEAKYDQIWAKIDGLQGRIRGLRGALQKKLG